MRRGKYHSIPVNNLTLNDLQELVINNNVPMGAMFDADEGEGAFLSWVTYED